jgi:formaldehyde-activating enzyme involved in methanogenesis
MDPKNINVKIGAELEKLIADKVAEAVKGAYYGNVASAVNEKIIAKMVEEKYMDRIVIAVFQKIQISEDEYVEKISTDIKAALLSISATLTTQAIKAVEEKIKSYGFIQIGR